MTETTSIIGPCPRCVKRGKDWEGDDPKCAFLSGKFSGANWNCATMNNLRAACDDLEQRYRDDMDAGSFGWLHSSIGYVVMTWYKDRGCTADALLMHDGYRTELSLKDAEQVLAELERTSPSQK